MAERRITVERELAEREVQVERENVIINNIDKIEGVFPVGTLDITENGVHDVTTYKEVNAQVPGIDDAFNAAIDVNLNNQNAIRLWFSHLLNYPPSLTVGEAVSSVYFGQDSLFVPIIFNNQRLKLTGGSARLAYINGISADLISGTLCGVTELDLSELTVASRVFFGSLVTGAMCKKVTLPDQECQEANDRIFYGASALEYIDMGGVMLESVSASQNAFNGCAALKTLIIRREDQVMPGGGTNWVTSSGIEAGTCLIYVPDELLDAYKADSVWGTYADQIKPLSELPEEE